jgi:hypothetical protein
VVGAVRRALERDPAERFANATEFIDALAPSRSASSARARGIPRTLVAGIVATLIGFTLTAALVSKSARSPAATPSAPSPTVTLPATVAPAGPTVTPVLDKPPLAPAAPASTALSPPQALPARTVLKAPSSPKRRAPRAPDAGVASSLQLSTREP